MTTEEELSAIVDDIAGNIEAAVAGDLYRIDGDFAAIYDIEEWRMEKWDAMKAEFLEKHKGEKFDEDLYDSEDEWVEDEIGVPDDVDDPEQASLDEYINEAALGDVRVTVGLDKDVYGGEVKFACGGPTVTAYDDVVRGWWGADTREHWLSDDARSAMYDWFETAWDSVK